MRVCVSVVQGVLITGFSVYSTLTTPSLVGASRRRGACGAASADVQKMCVGKQTIKEFDPMHGLHPLERKFVSQNLCIKVFTAKQILHRLHLFQYVPVI